MNSSTKIEVGARGSALSRVQVREVLQELQAHKREIEFVPIWVETTGDRDKLQSLRHLDKTDFFTRELDQMQLQGECRITIHSAKDLPSSLPKGLSLVALTKGVDPSDSLVFREGQDLHSLPIGAKIGSSSIRRDLCMKRLREDLACVDIRGTILERLEQLDKGLVDGVIIAEAALIRLSLTHRSRYSLEGETVSLQGRLAILAREDDGEMRELFSLIDAR